MELTVGTFKVPTDAPESDGTFAWDATTLWDRKARRLGVALTSLLGSVDVLQADATRCGGITGFMQADALCFAHGTPLSAHCAPNLAVHPMAEEAERFSSRSVL